MNETDVRGATIAARALDLCGTRFRLHGRSPDTGLDCIGLVQQALSAANIDCSAPTGYAMRGASPDIFVTALCEAGLSQLPAGLPMQPGDIVLTRPSPVQMHLSVCVKGGFVHAHAGLRRVIFEPDSAGLNLVTRFRVSENYSNISILEA